MPNRTIHIWPLNLKIEKCHDIEVFNTHNLDTIIYDMIDTMSANNTQCLSAPQIGVYKNIIIINYRNLYKSLKKLPEDTDYNNVNQLILINPQLSGLDNKTNNREKCISVFGNPEIDINRWSNIIVEFDSVNGKRLKIEAFDKLSFLIQHSYDHMCGLTYLDRVSKLKRSFIIKRIMRNIQLDVNNEYSDDNMNNDEPNKMCEKKRLSNIKKRNKEKKRRKHSYRG